MAVEKRIRQLQNRYGNFTSKLAPNPEKSWSSSPTWRRPHQDDLKSVAIRKNWKREQDCEPENWLAAFGLVRHCVNDKIGNEHERIFGVVRRVSPVVGPL